MQPSDGIDVVLDMLAGAYVARDMAIMALRGRHVTIGVKGGKSEATIPMNLVLRNRFVITASTLRSCDLHEKRAIHDALSAHVWPMVERGLLKPVIHATYPLHDAAAAQTAMESSEHTGMIILTV